MKLLIATLAVGLSIQTLPAGETIKTDVLIIGATPAGVASAVAAAKSGADVVLLEETSHVGGIISGGLTNTDIRKIGAVGGSFAEFVKRVRDYYVRQYGGEDSKQVKICAGGHMFEPHVAEHVFREMLACEKSIRLIERYRVVSAKVTGADGSDREAERGKRMDGATPKAFSDPVKLTTLVAENLAKLGERTIFKAGVFIDATYEGDVAAMAGVPYRVGRESRAAFGEPHAGQIFIRFGDRNPLPDSTGAADDGIQGFCFRFHMTEDPANLVPVERPAAYNRDDYRHVLADVRSGRVTKFTQVIQLYPMPNGNMEANSDHPHPDTGVPSESLDLAEENWSWPEANAEQRAKIFDRYWSYNEGLIWFLQHDEEVPESIRQQGLRFGFPKNEFVDHRNRPHHLYVRQGRRIWGEYNFTERDADAGRETGLPKRQPDGVAVAEYPFDCHGVSKFDPAHPFLRPGYFYVDHDPLQLPYRILVPRCVDGLLVPVACSASHVGYQTIRMEPVFMALGDAAGIAAKVALDAGKSVRQVDVTAVQRAILRRGGVILYEPQPLRPEGL